MIAPTARGAPIREPLHRMTAAMKKPHRPKTKPAPEATPAEAAT